MALQQLKRHRSGASIAATGSVDSALSRRDPVTGEVLQPAAAFGVAAAAGTGPYSRAVTMPGCGTG